MKKKPTSRKNLWALAQSHMLGHQFTLPGQDRQSDDDNIRLSHNLLEAAVRCYIDAKIDAADVARRIREAANQVDAHAGGGFELTGWNVVAHQKELAFAYLLLEQAIIVRLENASDPVAVGMWLRDATDLLQSETPSKSGAPTLWCGPLRQLYYSCSAARQGTPFTSWARRYSPSRRLA